MGDIVPFRRPPGIQHPPEPAEFDPHRNMDLHWLGFAGGMFLFGVLCGLWIAGGLR